MTSPALVCKGGNFKLILSGGKTDPAGIDSPVLYWAVQASFMDWNMKKK